MSNTILWGTRSLSNLRGVHPDLVSVMHEARRASPIDFIITEGLRTKERQRELVRAGASQTLKSRHLTGHAVDVAARLNGRISWDWPLYHQIAEVVKEAASNLDIAVEWGGDWTSFKDGPHYQLPWDQYPADASTSIDETVSGSDCSRLTLQKDAPSTYDSCVEALQHALNLWTRRSPDFFPIAEDGYFGPATARRVEIFQDHKGLVRDGIAGPKTWKALSDYLQEKV